MAKNNGGMAAYGVAHGMASGAWRNQASGSVISGMASAGETAAAAMAAALVTMAWQQRGEKWHDIKGSSVSALSMAKIISALASRSM